jgi:hypothetical protein
MRHFDGFIFVRPSKLVLVAYPLPVRDEALLM